MARSVRDARLGKSELPKVRGSVPHRAPPGDIPERIGPATEAAQVKEMTPLDNLCVIRMTLPMTGHLL